MISNSITGVPAMHNGIFDEERFSNENLTENEEAF